MRFSRLGSRLETLITVIETERAMLAPMVLLTPMVWNFETGSKVKVPGPAAENSYTADTVKESGSIEVANVTSSLKPYHRARQSPSCRQG